MKTRLDIKLAFFELFANSPEEARSLKARFFLETVQNADPERLARLKQPVSDKEFEEAMEGLREELPAIRRFLKNFKLPPEAVCSFAAAARQRTLN